MTVIDRHFKIVIISPDADGIITATIGRYIKFQGVNRKEYDMPSALAKLCNDRACMFMAEPPNSIKMRLSGLPTQEITIADIQSDLRQYEITKGEERGA